MNEPGLRLKIKHQNLLNRYLSEFETTPNYKKLLHSMIKFDDMYRPLHKGCWQIDVFDQIGALNEHRKLIRAQIYMNKRDIIATADKTGSRKLVVTSRGHKVFYKDYPLAKLRKSPWDGFWTIISYDFPEKVRGLRDRFRRKIIKFGFGSPQQSLFVSPLPIEEGLQKFVDGEQLNEFVWITKAERILGMENNEVAERSWNLKELNELYQALLESVPQTKKSKRAFEKWQRYFLALNAGDPYLPQKLLPENWLGAKCEKQFRKLDPLKFLKILFS